MIVAYDVIFSVIVGLLKVYPNFLDVPHSVLQQYEEKLRAPLMHTGAPQPKDYASRRRPVARHSWGVRSRRRRRRGVRHRRRPEG